MFLVDNEILRQTSHSVFTTQSARFFKDHVTSDDVADGCRLFLAQHKAAQRALRTVLAGRSELKPSNDIAAVAMLRLRRQVRVNKE